MLLIGTEDHADLGAKASPLSGLAQSETLRTWRSPLRGTREVSRMPERLSGRFMKAQAAR